MTAVCTCGGTTGGWHAVNCPLCPPNAPFLGGIQWTAPPQTGWLCPACGAGNAPWSARCSCVNQNPAITITTTGTTENPK